MTAAGVVSADRDGGSSTAVATAVVRFGSTAGLRFDRLQEGWIDRLGERERLSLAGLRADEDRRDLLAAHVLLRRALGEWAGIDPATVSIEHDQRGRPVTDLGVAVSLTHCRGLVACAIGELGEDTGIGVDAEPVASGERLATFAEDYLEPSEIDWAHAEPAIRMERLIQLWTAKEAVLKARELGFGGTDGRSSLRSVVFPTATIAAGAPLASDRDEEVWSWTIDSSHLVSLARTGTTDGPRPPTIARLAIAGESDRP